VDQQDNLLHVETIAGLSIAPQADLPFGKQFQMGLAIYTIYDRATEQGFQAGAAAHLDYLESLHLDAPVMVDETHFALIFETFLPKDLSPENASIWKAHFIAGWASVYMGLSGMQEWYARHEEA
jgi:hypothetical protein